MMAVALTCLSFSITSGNRLQETALEALQVPAAVFIGLARTLAVVIRHLLAIAELLPHTWYRAASHAQAMKMVLKVFE